ncbi:MAG TPA: sigma-70 family RNA polymerase sigma factor [Dyella sp.]|uniref:RNA polymerase sigma factor n=1 Tax=Dyella sp. TaxID=1869338 RepID=UPI002F9592C2
MTEDQRLVQAVLARKAGAFERLVREYQGLCWHIVYRMVRHPEDARELCQEVFLRVHRCLHQYRGDSALKSWIGQVAYTIALRHLQRRRIPLVEPPDDEDGQNPLEQIDDGFDLEAACADEELNRHLQAALESLPPLPRTVLTLYHLDELSIAEIAMVTGLASGTIKSHLFRSRRQLRERLEQRIGTFS